MIHDYEGGMLTSKCLKLDSNRTTSNDTQLPQYSQIDFRGTQSAFSWRDRGIHVGLLGRSWPGIELTWDWVEMGLSSVGTDLKMTSFGTIISLTSVEIVFLTASSNVGLKQQLKLLIKL